MVAGGKKSVTSKTYSFGGWQKALTLRGLGGGIITETPHSFWVEENFCALETAGILGFYDFLPHTYERTKNDCDNAHCNYALLSLIKKGQGWVEQGINASSLKKGDVFLRLTSEPFRVGYSVDTSLVSYIVREEVFRQWLWSPEDVVGMPLQARSNWGVALSASMNALTDRSFDGSVVPASAVAEQILCLFSLTASQSVPRVTSYKAKVLKRLQSELRNHLSDPQFCPLRLAEVVGISRRSLHAVFACAGTSFGKELAKMRLERSRCLLESACCDGRSIAEICRMVGYNSVSLFITRFRQLFGVTPDAYRRIRIKARSV